MIKQINITKLIFLRWYINNSVVVVLGAGLNSNEDENETNPGEIPSSQQGLELTNKWSIH